MDSKTLTHLNDQGEARMVDVGNKEITARRAVAHGRIVMQLSTLDLIAEGGHAKGDVLAVDGSCRVRACDPDLPTSGVHTAADDVQHQVHELPVRHLMDDRPGRGASPTRRRLVFRRHPTDEGDSVKYSPDSIETMSRLAQSARIVTVSVEPVVIKTISENLV